MAFDWCLRIGIEATDDPLATTAYAGWCQGRDAIGGRYSPLMPFSRRDSIGELFTVARRARGEDGRPRDEMQLTRIAVALARYENCYRGGVRRDDPLVPLGVAPSLAALLGLCRPFR